MALHCFMLAEALHPCSGVPGERSHVWDSLDVPIVGSWGCPSPERGRKSPPDFSAHPVQDEVAVASA